MKSPKIYFLINYKKSKYGKPSFFEKIFDLIPYGRYIYDINNKRKQNKIIIYLNAHLKAIKNKRKGKYAIQKLLTKEICDTISHEYFHHTIKDLNIDTTGKQDHKIIKFMSFNLN